MATKVMVTSTASGTNTSSGTTTTSASMNSTPKQIPIVCPGHTRPLAELQFCDTTTSTVTTTTNSGTCVYRCLFICGTLLMLMCVHSRVVMNK